MENGNVTVLWHIFTQNSKLYGYENYSSSYPKISKGFTELLYGWYEKLCIFLYLMFRNSTFENFGFC